MGARSSRRETMAAASGFFRLRMAKPNWPYSSHLLYPRQFEFDPTGRTIASIGQDWVLRLWDARTGQDLLTSVGRHRVVRFSRDGRRISTAPTDRELASQELAPENVFREFHRDTGVTGCGGRAGLLERWALVVDPQPQLRLYDTTRGGEVALLNMPQIVKHAFFDNDRPAVLYSAMNRGTYRREFFPITNGAMAGNVQWGEEQLMARHTNALICEGHSIETGRGFATAAIGVEFW